MMTLLCHNTEWDKCDYVAGHLMDFLRTAKQAYGEHITA